MGVTSIDSKNIHMNSFMKRLLHFYTSLYVWFFSIIPTKIGVLLRYYSFRLLFKKCGSFNLETGVTIVGFRNIELGNNVSFNKNSYLYSDDGGTITIGDNCSFNTNTMINATPGHISIGDGSAVGPNTVLRASNHSYTRKDIPIKKQAQIYGEIIIGKDVWIGANCVILANTKVGHGSVVGAGSVVSKDVAPYSVVAGVPAKIIKMREDTTTEVKLK
jgi:galactoside O-acetyltransferase